MRIRHVLGFSFLACLFLPACSTMVVKSQYDKAAKFDSLKSWAWVPEDRKESGAPAETNAALDDEVRKALESELARKGYAVSSSGTPDFYVSYQVSREEKVMHGVAGSGKTGGVTTYDIPYAEGTLIVDVLGPEKPGVLWRGWAEAQLEAKTKPEERKKLIDEATRKILSKFPPSAH